ncbi:hypothetical protein BV898_02724 [Hypsibius exemplaris]|uniref:Uncharacterized protein n=1 Tax=Hypsibius exemplaris TaxID=2072580 RepID=A0A1W0X7J0_HYPEX|nr:hypothetical protein BV898_02724 [Hypsibius exemplaris]
MCITRHHIIRRSNLFHHDSTFAGSTDETASSLHAAKRRSTLDLICCSVIYCITQLPNVIYKILEVSSKPPYCSYNLTFAAGQGAQPIVNVILWSN